MKSSVLLLTLVSATAHADPDRFGARGEIVIDNRTQQVVLTRTHIVDGSTTSFTLAPSFNVFVAEHVMAGVQAEYDVTSTPGSSEHHYLVGIDGGYDLPIGGAFSLWPQVAIYYQRSHGTIGPDTETLGTSVGLTLSVPVLWHPAPHFFLGAGPTATIQRNDGSPFPDYNSTSIGVAFTLGGYFGGAD
jgi:hypothetical protein